MQGAVIQRRGCAGRCQVRAGGVGDPPDRLGQDGAQLRLAGDQHAVQEFAAQRAAGRSQVAFIRGARTAVRKMMVPAPGSRRRMRP